MEWWYYDLPVKSGTGETKKPRVGYEKGKYCGVEYLKLDKYEDRVKNLKNEETPSPARNPIVAQPEPDHEHDVLDAQRRSHGEHRLRLGMSKEEVVSELGQPYENVTSTSLANEVRNFGDVHKFGEYGRMGDYYIVSFKDGRIADFEYGQNPVDK